MVCQAAADLCRRSGSGAPGAVARAGFGDVLTPNPQNETTLHPACAMGLRPLPSGTTRRAGSQPRCLRTPTPPERAACASSTAPAGLASRPLLSRSAMARGGRAARTRRPAPAAGTSDAAWTRAGRRVADIAMRSRCAAHRGCHPAPHAATSATDARSRRGRAAGARPTPIRHRSGLLPRADVHAQTWRGRRTADGGRPHRRSGVSVRQSPNVRDARRSPAGRPSGPS